MYIGTYYTTHVNNKNCKLRPTKINNVQIYVPIKKYTRNSHKVHQDTRFYLVWGPLESNIKFNFS